LTRRVHHTRFETLARGAQGAICMAQEVFSDRAFSGTRWFSLRRVSTNCLGQRLGPLGDAQARPRREGWRSWAFRLQPEPRPLLTRPFSRNCHIKAAVDQLVTVGLEQGLRLAMKYVFPSGLTWSIGQLHRR